MTKMAAAAESGHIEEIVSSNAIACDMDGELV